MTGFFSSYLGNIKSTVLSNHKLSKIPFLIEISSNISKFYEFYFNHKPNHIIYYILYPIFAPLGVTQLPADSVQKRHEPAQS